MNTNVTKVHDDAVAAAELRVTNTLDAFRKVGNMRKWALTDDERRQVVDAILRNAQSMADILLESPQDGPTPFRLS